MDFLRRRRQSFGAGNDDDDDDDIRNNAPASASSRKPPNTAFRQQRLKAWQPILTPNAVIPLLFLVAAIFAPLGIAIFYSTWNVQVLTIDYSNCALLDGQQPTPIPDSLVAYHFKKKNSNPDCKWQVLNSTAEDGSTSQQCRIQFNVPVDIPGPIFFYYQLTNFYQNHRKYVELYDLGQLSGKAVAATDLSDNCKPLTTIGDKIVYPCGLIANSLFNDTFSDPVLLNPPNGEVNQTYIISHKDISWESDRTRKFKKTQYDPQDIVPPPNWAKRFPSGYTLENIPDLQEWELLQNWMRTAGLPSFYKLYGKNTTAALTLGTYELTIDLNYPVEVFGGTKLFVMTTNLIFGARNMALGSIYLIIAMVLLTLAIAFLMQYLIKPRRMGEHKYLQLAGRSDQISAMRETL